MSQRCRDVFTWWRQFMGSTGPSPITRLVLCGHMLFMDRDGGNCRVGVRRLADVTGLNKSTITEHRANAIKAGWLVLSGHPATSRRREICAAVPDDIANIVHRAMSGETVQSVSGVAGQPTSKYQNPLYGLIDATVRFQPSNCPAPPYIPLLPLKNAVPKLMSSGQRAAKPEKRLFNMNSQSALQQWLLTDVLAQCYKHDVAALVRLTPVAFRYPSYEDVIRKFVNRNPALNGKT